MQAEQLISTGDYTRAIQQQRNCVKELQTFIDSSPDSLSDKASEALTAVKTTTRAIERFLALTLHSMDDSNIKEEFRALIKLSDWDRGLRKQHVYLKFVEMFSTRKQWDAAYKILENMRQEAPKKENFTKYVDESLMRQVYSKANKPLPALDSFRSLEKADAQVDEDLGDE